MDKRKFWRNLTRIHKWAGLVLGIQIILWFASGLFMSFFDINNVRGDHIAEKQTWPLQMEQAVPFDVALDKYIKDQEGLKCRPWQKSPCIIDPINNVSLLSGAGMPIWEFDNGTTKVHYISNPSTRNPVKYWEGFSEDKIKELARSYYKGDAPISKAVLFSEIAPKDFRKDVPIWQIAFDDKSKTRLYIDPIDGALVNVRTRLWRTFDFMWMLHIMDYKDRSNFNLWWLKLAAFAALLFALSGAALVTHRVFLRPRPQKSKPR